MLRICGICEKETQHEFIRASKPVNVRGESIEVIVEYHKCADCGEESIDLNSEYDHLAEAYKEYRQRHGMIQPEKMRSWRKQYALTQGELSRLLGWGATTLSRYENGALQDDTHDRALRLVMEPGALLKLVEEEPDALNPGKKEELTGLLQDEERQLFSYSRFLEVQTGAYGPDEFSGYKRLDVEKVVNAILYFCGEGDFKTKLNKLLFYLDFKHFKEQSVSVTGLRYAHLPYGPVPNDFEAYFSYMEHHGMLRTEECFFGDDSAEKYFAEQEPRLALFSDAELKTLMNIKEKFQGLSSRAISDLSHDEVGYKATQPGDLISYDFAQQLQI